MGSITKENAHPFQYGNITGCHNGCISNYDEVGTFAVDSMAIFSLLNDNKNDFKTVFKKLQGSMAVSWHDGKNIYLMRHNNPLYVAYNKKSVYWCSELLALKSILISHGLDMEYRELLEDMVHEITPKLMLKQYKVHFKPYEKPKKTKEEKQLALSDHIGYQTGYKSSYGYSDYNYSDSYNSMVEKNRKVIKELDDLTIEYINLKPDKRSIFLNKNARRIGILSGCDGCRNMIGRKTHFYINDENLECSCTRCMIGHIDDGQGEWYPVIN